MIVIEQRSSSSDKLFRAKTAEEIIAVDQEIEMAAKRQRILEKMTPACREKLQFVDNWLRKEVTHCLRNRYALGLEVLELYEDEQKNGGKLYGKNAIGRICTILGWDDGVIRLALRFVQTFTQEDLDRLCAAILPGGEPLTWSHVRSLIAVDNATHREELLGKTVAEGWTCKELAHEIVKLGQRPGEQRGRPPRVPKDFDSAVAQQQQTAEHWNRLHDQVWSNPERSLLTHAAKLPPEAVTEERHRQARELAKFLRRVANQALEQAEKVEQIVRDFELILSGRMSEEAANRVTTERDTVTV